MTLVIKQIRWLHETEEMTAAYGMCPHDGIVLSVIPTEPPMRYCSSCRRVWTNSGNRLPTVWWGRAPV